MPFDEAKFIGLLSKLMDESKFLQNSHDLTPQEDRGEWHSRSARPSLATGTL